MRKLLVAAAIAILSIQQIPLNAATYLELHNLAVNPASPDLRNRIEVAVTVAAQLILEQGSPTHSDEKIAWAQKAIANPQVWAVRALRLALADNKDLTTTQIQNATDAQIQANIDAVVPQLARGFVLGE